MPQQCSYFGYRDCSWKTIPARGRQRLRAHEDAVVKLQDVGTTPEPVVIEDCRPNDMTVNATSPGGHHRSHFRHSRLNTGKGPLCELSKLPAQAVMRLEERLWLTHIGRE